MTMIDLSGLQEQGVKGYIRFSIKADDTPENQTTHEDFKKFSTMVCKGDYTLALRLLMLGYGNLSLFESSWDKIKSMEEQITNIEGKLLPSKDDGEDDGGAF